MRVLGSWLLAACVALGAVGGLSLSRAQETAAAVGAGADWSAPGGAADESGYSRLDRITAANVGKLGLAWSLDLPGEVSLEATPLAVDGVLYFPGDRSVVYAVRASTGKLLWKYDPQIWKVNPGALRQYAASRGVAYADGLIFVGVLDGRLEALDAKTGTLAWSVQTLPPGKVNVQAVRGAPRTFAGKVIIGNGGGDSGNRGFVTAYDQRTGKQAWRFYTVPGSPEQNKGDPVMEMAAKTWSGEYWKTGTGGTVWNGMTFDPELGRIYVGVSNAAPYNPAVRSPGNGDNLFITSIVALDANTGRYVWHYQVNPREGWDYKATANMIAATLTIDGKPRKVLMQAPSNGFFYVLDRTNGKLISAEKIGKVTWAERIDLETGRPVEAANIRYETGETLIWPSMLGAHNWQPMAFNPQTGLAYIPYMHLGARFKTKLQPGDFDFGGVTFAPYKADADDGTGQLLAWDPVAQKAVWRAPRPHLWNGGALTTAGRLVFQGTADGHFSAYDARDGKAIWRYNAGLGIIGAPISYTVGDQQYVSILVGYGGLAGSLGPLVNVGWKYGAQPRRLLTFALGGKARLPATAPPDMTLRPVDDPSITLDAAAVQKGRALSARCAVCHGVDLQSAGAPAPDLRESRLALSEPAFTAVVHDGVLIQKGMPRFDNLTADQVHALWSYVRAAAREAKTSKK